LIRAPGVEIIGLSATVMRGSYRHEQHNDILTATHHFRPYLEKEGEYDASALSPLLQCVSIVIENKRSRKLNRKFDILQLTQTPASDEAFKTMDLFLRVYGTMFEVVLVYFFSFSFNSIGVLPDFLMNHPYRHSLNRYLLKC
jgi:hypothetical protein